MSSNPLKPLPLPTRQFVQFSKRVHRDAKDPTIAVVNLYKKRGGMHASTAPKDGLLVRYRTRQNLQRAIEHLRQYGTSDYGEESANLAIASLKRLKHQKSFTMPQLRDALRPVSMEECIEETEQLAQHNQKSIADLKHGQTGGAAVENPQTTGPNQAPQNMTPACAKNKEAQKWAQALSFACTPQRGASSKNRDAARALQSRLNNALATLSVQEPIAVDSLWERLIGDPHRRQTKLLAELQAEMNKAASGGDSPAQRQKIADCCDALMDHIVSSRELSNDVGKLLATGVKKADLSFGIQYILVTLGHQMVEHAHVASDPNGISMNCYRFAQKAKEFYADSVDSATDAAPSFADQLEDALSGINTAVNDLENAELAPQEVIVRRRPPLNRQNASRHLVQPQAHVPVQPTTQASLPARDAAVQGQEATGQKQPPQRSVRSKDTSAANEHLERAWAEMEAQLANNQFSAMPVADALGPEPDDTISQFKDELSQELINSVAPNSNARRSSIKRKPEATPTLELPTVALRQRKYRSSVSQLADEPLSPVNFNQQLVENPDLRIEVSLSDLMSTEQPLQRADGVELNNESTPQESASTVPQGITTQAMPAAVEVDHGVENAEATKKVTARLRNLFKELDGFYGRVGEEGQAWKQLEKELLKAYGISADFLDSVLNFRNETIEAWGQLEQGGIEEDIEIVELSDKVLTDLQRDLWTLNGISILLAKFAEKNSNPEFNGVLNKIALDLRSLSELRRSEFSVVANVQKQCRVLREQAQQRLDKSASFAPQGMDFELDEDIQKAVSTKEQGLLDKAKNAVKNFLGLGGAEALPESKSTVPLSSNAQFVVTNAQNVAFEVNGTETLNVIAGMQPAKPSLLKLAKSAFQGAKGAKAMMENVGPLQSPTHTAPHKLALTASSTVPSPDTPD